MLVWKELLHLKRDDIQEAIAHIEKYTREGREAFDSHPREQIHFSSLRAAICNMPNNVCGQIMWFIAIGMASKFFF